MILTSKPAIIVDIFWKKNFMARPTELRAAMNFGLEKSSLDAFADLVRLLDPVNTMARGWSITRNTAGNIVRDVTKLKTGDKLVTTFANGSTASTIQEISTKGKQNGKSKE